MGKVTPGVKGLLIGVGVRPGTGSDDVIVHRVRYLEYVPIIYIGKHIHPFIVLALQKDWIRYKFATGVE